MLKILPKSYIGVDRESTRQIISQIYRDLEIIGIVENMDDFRCIIEDNGYDLFDDFRTKSCTYPVIITIIPDYKEFSVKIFLYPVDMANDLNKSIFNGTDNETSDTGEIIRLIYKLAADQFHVEINGVPRKETYTKNKILIFLSRYNGIVVLYRDKESDTWKLEFSEDENEIKTIILGKTVKNT